VLRRQVCWAHLVWELAGFVERGGTAARIGELLLAEILVMFEWWHNARDGTIKRATFQKKMQPLMREVERLLAGSGTRPPPEMERRLRILAPASAASDTKRRR
jgi:hypothetical protein